MRGTVWIATIGAPRGHRIRFAQSNSGALNIRVLECECGWHVNFGEDKPNGEAIAAHARHVDLVRMGAWPPVREMTFLDPAFDGLLGRPAPHPAELGDDRPTDELELAPDVPHTALCEDA